jgi:hypothetical protein
LHKDREIGWSVFRSGTTGEEPRSADQTPPDAIRAKTVSLGQKDFPLHFFACQYFSCDLSLSAGISPNTPACFAWELENKPGNPNIASGC